MNRVRATDYFSPSQWVGGDFFSITSYLFFKGLYVSRVTEPASPRESDSFFYPSPQTTRHSLSCVRLGSWPPWPPLLEWTLVGAPTRSRPVRRLLRWACRGRASTARATHPAPRASPLSPRCGAALRVGPFGLEAERCQWHSRRDQAFTGSTLRRPAVLAAAGRASRPFARATCDSPSQRIC